MYSNWIADKSKKEKFDDVEKIINFITEIRSFKNELGISPGSFIDISFAKIDKNKQNFFK